MSQWRGRTGGVRGVAITQAADVTERLAWPNRRSKRSIHLGSASPHDGAVRWSCYSVFT